MKAPLLLFIILFSLNQANAEVRLPRLIRDSMILQRDIKIKIWGWATQGEKISIKFNGKKFKTTTGADGKWLVMLSPMKAGGPYAMEITGNNKITLKDILIGDVWICTGQSNMVHQMFLHRELYEDDIAAANYPAIREFWIPNVSDLQKQHEDLAGGFWKSADPKNVLQFSAVAYYFAKKIYEKYHVPIGIINATVGGPGIEAWISEEELQPFPQIAGKITKNKDTAYVNSINRAAYAANANRPKPHDKGLMTSKPWYDTGYVPKNWRNIIVPGFWEDQGIKDLDGIVWYRKQIDVPASMTGIPAKVFLGRIVDADDLYVNGVKIGSTYYQYPQRRYSLPAGSLKPGKNIFVVRVTNNSGKGGFVPDKPYHIIAGEQKIDLKGEWQYKVGDVFSPRQNQAAPSIAPEYQPTAIFNAMVSPFGN